MIKSWGHIHLVAVAQSSDPDVTCVSGAYHTSFLTALMIGFSRSIIVVTPSLIVDGSLL